MNEIASKRVTLPCDCRCCMLVVEKSIYDDGDEDYLVSMMHSSYIRDNRRLWTRVKNAAKVLFGKPVYYNDAYIPNSEKFNKFVADLNELAAFKGEEEHNLDYYKGFLEQINITLLERYLANSGWTSIEIKREDISVFQYAKDEGFEQVTIPKDQTLSDYFEALRKTVETIATVEGKLFETKLTELIRLSNVTEKREYFRQRIQTDAKLLDEDGKVIEGGCQVADISAGGILIRCEHPFSVGDRFAVKALTVAENMDNFDLDCVVRRKAETESKGIFYGCEFVGLSKTEEERLLQAIFTVERNFNKGKRG